MTTEKGLNYIEDHLAVVRQLLTSAAACTLKAKQKIDHLTQKLDRVGKESDSNTAVLERVSYQSLYSQHQQLTQGSNSI